MKYKGHKAKSRAILLKFLVVNLVLAKATSPLCPKGTYKSTFTDDCSICPPDSKNNCKREGADTGSCEQACIEDVNECLTRPCHHNANCTDTEGSYDCKCNVGFSGNGLNCSNINECLTSPCHHNANCTDTEGSSVCQCNVGFSGNGLNCSNFNECLTSPCHPNANCTDTEGSYDCKCNVGFSGNGVTCTNIDECLSKPCHVNASCTDNEGSFDCECNVGFSGNGISNCANIDECLNVSCHVNADCLDSPGSYICRCKTGFNGNGTFCESDPSEQGRMNYLAMVIGISIALILLLLIAGLSWYCHRINKRCGIHRLAREHDEFVEMETVRGPTENQPLSQPQTAAAYDQQYNGPEIAPDLNKDNHGSYRLC